MHSLKRLKNILRFDDVSGLLIYIVPSIILLMLSNIYTLLFVFYILYQLYLYKRLKALFFYALVISLFFFFLYHIYYFIYKSYVADSFIKGVIVDSDDNSFLLREGLHYIKIYYNGSNTLSIGKRVVAIGRQKEIIERNVEGAFSYFRYNLSKKIIAEYQAYSVSVDENSFSIYSIRNFLFNHIENNYQEESKMFIERLVIAKSSFTKEINDDINTLGIVHLFCISGLHISILSLIIKKTLRIFNLQEEIISIFLIMVLFIYYFICLTNPAITRAIIMSVIVEISKFKNKNLMKTDSLFIAFIISLLINPMSILQIGFYLSYLSTVVIFLSKSRNIIKLSSLIILFTVPILLYYNQRISALILLNTVIFGIFFSYIFIPFTYMTLIFPPLDIIYNILSKILIGSIKIFNEIDIPLYFSISNIYYLFIIYILLLILIKHIKNKEKYVLYIFLIVFALTSNYFTSSYRVFPEITMIDVGQGDSILIRTGFKNILIDTGVYDKYNTTIKYLKKHNINKLDYVFISHEDNDHIGDIENLKSNIKIKNIIQNQNEKEFKINSLSIIAYYKITENKNESSMVLYMKTYDATYLFTGDIESLGEDNILTKNIRNITFLKVAHHGSKTSSKEEFLKKMMPKISLISCGKNNIYNHPADEVIERLNKINSKIYRTDTDGSITITSFPFFSIIRTYRLDEISIFDRFNNLGFTIH